MTHKNPLTILCILLLPLNKTFAQTVLLNESFESHFPIQNKGASLGIEANQSWQQTVSYGLALNWSNARIQQRIQAQKEHWESIEKIIYASLTSVQWKQITLSWKPQLEHLNQDLELSHGAGILWQPQPRLRLGAFGRLEDQSFAVFCAEFGQPNHFQFGSAFWTRFYDSHQDLALWNQFPLGKQFQLRSILGTNPLRFEGVITFKFEPFRGSFGWEQHPRLGAKQTVNAWLSKSSDQTNESFRQYADERMK
jgi:hypothetical protein